MDSLRHGNLTLQFEADDPRTITVCWLGRADSRKPTDILMPYLTKLADLAQKRASEVVFRLDELEHMNSSSLVVLMRFLADAKRLEVRVRVVYDGDRPWQRMSFSMLHQLAQRDHGLDVVAD